MLTDYEPRTQWQDSMVLVVGFFWRRVGKGGEKRGPAKQRHTADAVG